MQRLLIGGTIVIVLAVVAVLLYGVLYERVIKQNRPVVTVNGERVSIKQFQGLARYLRFTLIRNANQNFQLVQMFGSDPSTSASFANQLQQIQNSIRAYLDRSAGIEPVGTECDHPGGGENSRHLVH